MNRWQAVIFDLDDTLYPEQDYVLSGFCAVSKWLERRLQIDAVRTFSELRELHYTGIRGVTFNKWLLGHGLEPRIWLAPIITIYRQHKPAIRPFADTLPVLEELRPQYLLGLVSDGYLEAQRLKWGALGLAPYFQSVVFSDAWGREHWKPSVKPFVVVLSELSIPPQAAVYVADNPAKDFLGARRAGLSSIRVQRGVGEYAQDQPQDDEHAPDLTVTSLEQVLVFLDRDNNDSLS